MQRVTAAVIEKDGKILMAKRDKHDPYKKQESKCLN
jgi:uncharacterized membrane protein YcaP (DUF421 family)